MSANEFEFGSIVFIILEIRSCFILNGLLQKIDNDSYCTSHQPDRCGTMPF